MRTMGRVSSGQLGRKEERASLVFGGPRYLFAGPRYTAPLRPTQVIFLGDTRYFFGGPRCFFCWSQVHSYFAPTDTVGRSGLV